MPECADVISWPMHVSSAGRNNTCERNSIYDTGAYMYCVGDKALYIGASRKVVGRILARNHHVKGLEVATSLLVFPCKTWQEAKDLESCLCAECRPELNMRNGAIVRAQKVCAALGLSSQQVIHQYLRKTPA
jgi:hypothetical protein